MPHGAEAPGAERRVLKQGERHREKEKGGVLAGRKKGKPLPPTGSVAGVIDKPGVAYHENHDAVRSAAEELHDKQGAIFAAPCSSRPAKHERKAACGGREF